MANEADVLSKHRFIVEVDGIESFRASTVSGGTLKHNPIRFREGNADLPRHFKGTGEVDQVTIEFARFLSDSDASQEMLAWIQRWMRGTPEGENPPEKKTFRIIGFAADGRTEVIRYELIDALPVEYGEFDFDADTAEVSVDKIVFQADDVNITVQGTQVSKPGVTLSSLVA